MAAQQYSSMYQDFENPNRSPGRVFNGGNTLNRQSSRHFDNSYGVPQSQNLYGADDFTSRYDTTRGFDRMSNAGTMHANFSQYDNAPWSYGGGANGGAHTIGGTGRVKGGPPRRPQIPGGWLEPMGPPPPQNYSNMNSQYSHNHSHNNVHQQQLARLSPSNGDDEELIPTAIVIKNIPFAVKKEQLIAIMTDMNLPLPYAFNYHFDQGVFRGLAFANFTTADETAAVIDHMNHMELQGRKLRVEYKKMLPATEREKIERDKRERRGQLEEQHRPSNAPMSSAIMHQASMTSLNSAHAASSSPALTRGTKEYDLNDPQTLAFYNELMLFKNSTDREHLIFPTTTTPQDRRTIHTLAHHMGLEHRSEGAGDTRCVMILKTRTSNISPPAPQQISYYNESRRGLNRAATVDFSEVRDTYHSHTLGRQASGLLDIPGSPGLSGLTPAQNLRAAKSFADLRSYTPSPVPSSASFPANLAQNVSRYAEYAQASASGNTPNLTPTSGNDRSARDEAFLATSMSGMGLYERSTQSRVHNTGRIGQERELHNTNAGAIGSQRPVNGNNYDEQRNGTSTIPERQPRGPGAEWGGANFSRPRQNGHVNRGSGELDLSIVGNLGLDDNDALDSSDRSAPQRYL